MLDQIGLVDDPRRQRRRVINARLAAVGYPGPAGRDRRLSQSRCDSTNVLGKVDHQVSGRDQFSVRYSLYDVDSNNSRGAGGLSAPSASAGLDNLDQTLALSNTLTLSPRTVLETRAQFAHSDLQAPPTDPIGPAVSIAGVASFGTRSGSPTAPVEHDVPGRQQPVASGAARTRCAPASISSTTTTGSPIRASMRGSYTFSSLANFLRRHLQQRRLHADVRRHRRLADQSQPRRLRAGRVEGRRPR